MTATETLAVGCPYCGETIDLLLDCPPGVHEYIEDCQVCCRPMAVRVEAGHDGSMEVAVAHEDEA